MSEPTHNPGQGPPLVVHAWRPECMPTGNVEGEPPINLMDAFVLEAPNKSLNLKIPLPPSVYTPNWEFKDNLEDCIKKSALDFADTTLTSSGTDFQHSRLEHCHLRCEKCATHCPSDKTAGKENNGQWVREGVKHDKIVQKDKSSRGPTGKSEPR